MARDPEYVKLANRLTKGNVTDLRSGFSLAGLDVVEFPETEAQAVFVRSALRAGKVEEATEDEFDAVNGDEIDLYAAQGFELERPKIKASWQEGAARAVAAEARAAVRESRGLSASGDPHGHHGSDKNRRKALAKAAAEIEKGETVEDTDGVTEFSSGVGSEPARRAAAQRHPAAKSGRSAGGKKGKHDEADSEPLDVREAAAQQSGDVGASAAAGREPEAVQGPDGGGVGDGAGSAQ